MTQFKAHEFINVLYLRFSGREIIVHHTFSNLLWPCPCRHIEIDTCVYEIGCEWFT